MKNLNNNSMAIKQWYLPELKPSSISIPIGTPKACTIVKENSVNRQEKLLPSIKNVVPFGIINLFSETIFIYLFFYFFAKFQIKLS